MNAKSTKRRAAGSYITWPHSLTKWYAQQALYLIVVYYHINLAQSLQHIWALHHTPSELMTSKVAVLVHTRCGIETLALINGHYSSHELRLFTSTPSVVSVRL